MLKTMPGNPSCQIGLDYLRLFAMFLVVLLHVFNFTGLLSPLPSRLSATVLSVWATEYLAIIAVNLFVLISGYFLCTRSFKWQK